MNLKMNLLKKYLLSDIVKIVNEYTTGTNKDINKELMITSFKDSCAIYFFNVLEMNKTFYKLSLLNTEPIRDYIETLNLTKYDMILKAKVEKDISNIGFLSLKCVCDLEECRHREIDSDSESEYYPYSGSDSE